MVLLGYILVTSVVSCVVRRSVGADRLETQLAGGCAAVGGWERPRALGENASGCRGTSTLIMTMSDLLAMRCWGRLLRAHLAVASRPNRAACLFVYDAKSADAEAACAFKGRGVDGSYTSVFAVQDHRGSGHFVKMTDRPLMSLIDAGVIPSSLALPSQSC